MSWLWLFAVAGFACQMLLNTFVRKRLIRFLPALLAALGLFYELWRMLDTKGWEGLAHISFLMMYGAVLAGLLLGYAVYAVIRAVKRKGAPE